MMVDNWGYSTKAHNGRTGGGFATFSREHYSPSKPAKTFKIESKSATTQVRYRDSAGNDWAFPPDVDPDTMKEKIEAIEKKILENMVASKDVIRRDYATANIFANSYEEYKDLPVEYHGMEDIQDLPYVDNTSGPKLTINPQNSFYGIYGEIKPTRSIFDRDSISCSDVYLILNR